MASQVQIEWLQQENALRNFDFMNEPGSEVILDILVLLLCSVTGYVALMTSAQATKMEPMHYHLHAINGTTFIMLK